MNKIFLIAVIVFMGGLYAFTASNETFAKITENKRVTCFDVKNPNYTDEIKALYDSMDLRHILKYEAFEEAMAGYNSTKNVKNRNILTVIDFTLPSSEKRMFVLDIKNKKLLYHTIVSHGRNSGENYATRFSNRHGSYQSSLGFYLTSETYHGNNGFSLRLDGLERGINDQARPRAVVIHGADYCSMDIVRSTGRLGRSYGCPALPRELAKPIINTIKNGSMLYIYANDDNYLASSPVLKAFKRESKTMLAQHDDQMENSKEIILN